MINVNMFNMYIAILVIFNRWSFFVRSSVCMLCNTSYNSEIGGVIRIRPFIPCTHIFCVPPYTQARILKKKFFFFFNFFFFFFFLLGRRRGRGSAERCGVFCERCLKCHCRCWWKRCIW